MEKTDTNRRGMACSARLNGFERACALEDELHRLEQPVPGNFDREATRTSQGLDHPSRALASRYQREPGNSGICNQTHHAAQKTLKGKAGDRGASVAVENVLSSLDLGPVHPVRYRMDLIP